MINHINMANMYAKMRDTSLLDHIAYAQGHVPKGSTKGIGGNWWLW